MPHAPTLEQLTHLSLQLESTYLALNDQAPDFLNATLALIAADLSFSLSPLTWAYPVLGMKGARGLDGFDSLPPELKLHVLAHIQTFLPCSELLRALAEPCLPLLHHAAPSLPTQGLPPLSEAQRLALGLWLGHPSNTFGLDTAPEALQRQSLQLALTPYTPEAFTQGMALSPDTTALLAAQRLAIHDPLTLLSYVEASQTRLLVALYLGLQGHTDAASLIADIEEDWQDAQTPTERALADARLAGLAALDGDHETAAGLLRHALTGFEREQQPEPRRALYESCLLATSVMERPEALLNLLERFSNDRLVLRSREAFQALRVFALTRLAKAPLERSTFERGLLSLRELERRLPDPSLEMLRLAIAIDREYRDQRSPQVLVTDLGKLLREERPTSTPFLSFTQVFQVAPAYLSTTLEPLLARIPKAPLRFPLQSTLLHLSLNETLRA